MAIGGPIVGVSIAGRAFKSAGDASVTVQQGGKTVTTEPNGDGTARNIQAIAPWKCEGAALQIDSDAGDLEFLQGIADRGVNEVFTVEYASGAIYQGIGVPNGDLAEDTSKATAAINFAGPGKLTKQ
jgi:hypothetical protein